jgi:hypothetical protein
VEGASPSGGPHDGNPEQNSNGVHREVGSEGSCMRNPGPSPMSYGTGRSECHGCPATSTVTARIASFAEVTRQLTIYFDHKPDLAQV